VVQLVEGGQVFGKSRRIFTITYKVVVTLMFRSDNDFNLLYLIFDCLMSNGKHYMQIQDENKFNNR